MPASQTPLNFPCLLPRTSLPIPLNTANTAILFREGLLLLRRRRLRLLALPSQHPKEHGDRSRENLILSLWWHRRILILRRRPHRPRSRSRLQGAPYISRPAPRVKLLLRRVNSPCRITFRMNSMRHLEAARRRHPCLLCLIPSIQAPAHI